MRVAHFLQAGRRTERPRDLVFYDTETTPVDRGGGATENVLRFGWAVHVRANRKGEYSREDWWRFDDPRGFWRPLKAIARPHTKTWVFAHNQAFDMPVVKFWENTTGKGWRLRKAILEGPPTVVVVERNRFSLQFVDTLNYSRLPLRQIGESLGILKLQMPELEAPESVWDQYCKNDVQIIKLFILGLISMVVRHDLGTFQATLASQAFSAYRHRFLTERIFIDDNAKALAISRGSYHGGRTECFRIGAINRRLYYLDVNSMYPFVMRENLYPTRLVGCCNRVNIEELKRILETYLVTADVSIHTKDNVYPVRYEGRLIFPIGRFRTFITTPELVHAITNGHIESIHSMAIYEAANIFTDWVDELYNIRLNYKSNNNQVMAFLLKILMNSLYGKFGQSGRVWEQVGECELQDVETWSELDLPTGAVRRYRRIAGQIQQLCRTPESRESFPAISAHVTAYARCYLQSLMDLAGLKHVWYVDTDSLIVDSIGYARLSKLIDSHRLGALKLELVVDTGTIYTAKDYQLNERVVRKGVRGTAVELAEGVFQQPRFVGWAGMIRRGELDRQIVIEEIKTLSRAYRKGVVGRHGIVAPLILNQVQGF
jgi:hypothetical protein